MRQACGKAAATPRRQAGAMNSHLRPVERLVFAVVAISAIVVGLGAGARPRA
jgi:hypothetical protein